MRNKAAWLELQLTMHFTEDQANGNDIETQLVEDDCVKCKQLRKMLEESLQLPLVQIACTLYLEYDMCFSSPLFKGFNYLTLFIDLPTLIIFL